MAADFPVFTSIEEQRLSFLDFHILHFPNKNCMVAGQMRGNHLAIHPEKCAIEGGSAAGPPPIMDSQPLLRFGAVYASREVFGDGLLILFIDAHAELILLWYQLEHTHSM